MAEHYDARDRPARLEQALPRVGRARHRRATMRLLVAIKALASALVVLLLRRYGVL